MQEDDIILCPKCHVGRPRYLKECPHCKLMFGTGYKGNASFEKLDQTEQNKNNINNRHLIIGYFVFFIMIFILIRVCFL